MKLNTLNTLACLLAFLASMTLAHAEKKPLKVFILAGQSNMCEQARISTIKAIGLDPKTAPLLKDIQNGEGKTLVLENVHYVSRENKGKLGAELQDQIKPRIGPEYAFGVYMNKMLNEPILVIKAAWGGKSLIKQFRPPSAGGELPTGEYYTMMMNMIKKVLADPKSHCPAYDPKAGYEVAGFVWFQGYNDFVSKDYPQTGHKKSPEFTSDFSEYTRLLGCLIRDVRKELNSPNMPFVTGVFGMGGKQVRKKISDFRKAQAATAELPEFKGNVVNVYTEDYWPEKLGKLKDELVTLVHRPKEPVEVTEEVAKILQDLRKKQQELKPLEKGWKEADDPRQAKKELKKKKEEFGVIYQKLIQAHFTDEERHLMSVGSSQQGYHYHGSAKFVVQAGKAFAEAIVELNKGVGK